jgi:hypothetical protein
MTTTIKKKKTAVEEKEEDDRKFMELMETKDITCIICDVLLIILKLDILTYMRQ